MEGLTAANKEAVAFCLLGLATLLGVPSNVPSVTGASRSVVLGQVAVREGRNLLRSMHDVHRTAGEGFGKNVVGVCSVFLISRCKNCKPRLINAVDQNILWKPLLVRYFYFVLVNVSFFCLDKDRIVEHRGRGCG